MADSVAGRGASVDGVMIAARAVRVDDLRGKQIGATARDVVRAQPALRACRASAGMRDFVDLAARRWQQGVAGHAPNVAWRPGPDLVERGARTLRPADDRQPSERVRPASTIAVRFCRRAGSGRPPAL
ncbi:hypothetical protein ACVBGC_30350 [Burkholderia stagnalis]